MGILRYMSRHVKNQKRKRHGTAFWDNEYTNAEHLALSEGESEDLAKFTRWLMRRHDTEHLSKGNSVVDLGCGNGRNLVYLSREFGVSGIGYDSSGSAIKEAKRLGSGLPLQFEIHSIANNIPLPDSSQSLALDMMSSHFLNKAERTQLRDEIFRVLRPGGFLFMKTFLRDEDLHTERLIQERPGEEDGSYIHPVIGVAEYAYFEEELIDFLSERFVVHKTYASHKHRSKGKARKRRTVSIYAEKDPFV